MHTSQSKRQWLALKSWRSWLFLCFCNSSSLLPPRFFKLPLDHYRFSPTVLSICGHAFLDMPFWNSSLLSHSGASCPISPSPPYSGSHLWSRSVTKVPPTYQPLSEAYLMSFFFPSLPQPRNIPAADFFVCVRHYSLRDFISSYPFCKLSVCCWISTSSPAFWCHSFFLY